MHDDSWSQDTFCLESRIVDHRRKLQWIIKGFSKFPEETSITSKEFKLAPECPFSWEVTIELSTEYIFIDINRTDKVDKQIRVDGYLSFRNTEGEKYNPGGKILYVDCEGCHQLWSGKRPGHPTRELEDFPLQLPNDSLILICHITVPNCCVFTEEVTEDEQRHFLEERGPSQISLQRKKNNVEIPPTDVLLKVGDIIIPCHKSVLCSRSIVFRNILDGVNEINSVISLEDTDSNIPNELLTYLYTNTFCEVSHDVVCGLYKVAVKYEIEGLQDKCSLLLADNLNEKTVWGTLKLADLYNDVNLKENSSAYITEHFDELKDTSEFRSFVENNNLLFFQIISKGLRARK